MKISQDLSTRVALSRVGGWCLRTLSTWKPSCHCGESCQHAWKPQRKPPHRDSVAVNSSSSSCCNRITLNSRFDMRSTSFSLHQSLFLHVWINTVYHMGNKLSRGTICTSWIYTYHEQGPSLWQLLSFREQISILFHICSSPIRSNFCTSLFWT